MALKIGNSEELAKLTNLIMATDRPRPICVVTTEADSRTYLFDILELEDDASSVCDFYLLKTGELTYEFQNRLPADRHVYGGGARVYPVDFSIDPESNYGKIRLVTEGRSAAAATSALLGDIWGAANSAGLVHQSRPSSVAVVGRVSKLYGDAFAVVDLELYGMTTLRQEVAFNGIPLTWVLTEGQRVEGTYDVATRVFVLNQSIYTKDDMVKDFALNTVTLGLVKTTDRQSAKIAIHPNLIIEITKDEITGNPRDVISRYLGVGDVIEVRIYRDPQGRIRLRMDDIDGDEPVEPALILMPGGKPWLDADRHLLEEVEDEQLLETTHAAQAFQMSAELEELLEVALPEKPQHPIPGPGMVPGIRRVAEPIESKASQNLNQGVFAHYVREIKNLMNTGKRLEDENSMLSRLLADSQDKLSVQRKLVQASKAEDTARRREKLAPTRQNSSSNSRRSRFDSADAWFREEVRRAWIARYLPADREKFDLSDRAWLFSEKFFDTMQATNLDDSEMFKLIRIVTDLVSGRNAIDKLHEAHPLLAHGKKIEREDGAISMRMYIESNTPQAKRLHYYRLRDGRLELSQVGLHDDYAA